MPSFALHRCYLQIISGLPKAITQVMCRYRYSLAISADSRECDTLPYTYSTELLKMSGQEAYSWV